MVSPLKDPRFSALYEVMGPLGRGGMGEVVRIRHRVWEVDLAAKVPLPSAIMSAGGDACLRREAETWIRLPAHPNVVTCHYVRTFADTPVIFTELVDGGSLADALSRGDFRRGATTPDLVARALSTALDIARGLAHAHAAGIVHQDVKPSNVLMDAHGAKITDFGIAAAGRVDLDTHRSTPLRGEGTMRATVVGMTPHYASPEQLAALRAGGSRAEKKGTRTARGARKTITRATDIWSLGLTLLETLLGDAPWRPGLAEAALDKVDDSWADALPLLRQMLAPDPGDRPNAVSVEGGLVTLLEKRGVHRPAPKVSAMRAGALNNRAVSLLDLSLLSEARQTLREALASDPNCPEAVFNDALLAWRAGETTDMGALDRVRQAVSSSQDWEAELLEAWVQIERGDEKGAWAVLDRVAEHAAGAVRGTRAVARASRAVTDAVREIASFRASSGIADALSISDDEKLAVVGARDGAIGIFDLSSGSLLSRVPAHAKYVFGAHLTRDGRRVLSASWDGTFAAHELSGRRLLFRCPQPGSLSCLVVSPDERRAWTGSLSGTLRAWSLTDDSAEPLGDVLSLPNDLSVMCAVLSPDGRTLIAGGENNHLYFIDPESGETRRSVRLSSRPYELCWIKQGEEWLLLIGRGDQHVSAHDPESGEEVFALRGLQSWVSVVAASWDGRFVVCSDGVNWSLWDVSARRALRTWSAPALLTGASFLRDGRLVTLDWGGVVRIYAIEAPREAPTVVALPHRAREISDGLDVVDAALSRARRALGRGDVAGALLAARQARETKGFERDNNVLSMWRLIAPLAKKTGVRAVWPLERFGPVKASCRLAFDPKRRFVALADERGAVRLWALRDDEPPEVTRELTFEDGELASRALAVSSDGRYLAVGTYKRIHIFDLDGGTVQSSTVPRGYVRDVTFGGPSDSLVAALDDHGHVLVFQQDSLAHTATMRGPENWTSTVAFTDESHLLVGDYDGHLLLWDIQAAARSGFAPGEWSNGDDRAPAPAEAMVRDWAGFQAAGRRAISTVRARGDRVYYGCADGSLHVHELRTGKRISQIRGHKAQVSGFDFLDEDHVVTCSFDNTVRIFHIKNANCLSVVEGHTHTLWAVAALCADRILTLSDDGQARTFHIDWELDQQPG